MRYTEEFYKKNKLRIQNTNQFLQECKFSGSYETKLDLGKLIELLKIQDIVIDNLRVEIQNQMNKVVEAKYPKIDEESEIYLRQMELPLK